jgi:hypothetical protein
MMTPVTIFMVTSGLSRSHIVHPPRTHLHPRRPNRVKVWRSEVHMRALLALLVALLATGPAAARKWTAPRTADGQIDLQGFWTNATYTPFERPAGLAGKEFFTEEEATAYQQKRLDEDNSQPPDDIHYDNAIWLREHLPKTVSNLRTSLVVDPPDGRVPPLTPEARQRAAARAAARKESDPSDVKSRALAERCIIWPHVGPPMIPTGYNSNLQIVQTPRYVMILQEMIHDVRIIPLDGRPHLPGSVRSWMGDAVGHWEGDTLVVDTTNFREQTAFRGSSAALHVTERFTRVDADTIRYRFTVEDATTWARPWTGEVDMRRFPDRLFEYACHEGNHDLEYALRAASTDGKK